MTVLRLTIEINPGGTGARMDKLASITGEAERFLRLLVGDLGVTSRVGDWVSRDFYNSSVGYVSEFSRNVDDLVVPKFNDAIGFFVTFDGTKWRFDGNFSPRTIKQFVNFGKALDPDENLRIGLYRNGADKPTDWRVLNRKAALAVEKHIETPLEYIGSVQGRLGTWYKDSDHFDIHDLIFNEIVKCHYPKDKYATIYSLYEDNEAVVSVSGRVSADRIDGRPKSVVIDRIATSRPLTDDEFRRIFGLEPRLTGQEPTTDYIDRIRRDSDA